MLNAYQNPAVEAVFESYPRNIRVPLLQIRDLIFRVAERTEGVGPLVETLKWSQPSYLTEATGAGTTVRVDRFGNDRIAIFLHCQTTLIETFRELFPELEYSQNRAIVLNPADPLPDGLLSACIEMSLTYKLRKRNRRRGSAAVQRPDRSKRKPIS